MPTLKVFYKVIGEDWQSARPIEFTLMKSSVDPDVVGPEVRRHGFRSIFWDLSNPAISPQSPTQVFKCYTCGSRYQDGVGWVEPGCAGNCCDR